MIIPGLALILSGDGTIAEVVATPAGQENHFRTGRLFYDGLDSESRMKAETFFNDVLEKRASFGWELVLNDEEHPLVYHFAGFLLDGLVLILATEVQRNLIRLFEEVTAVSNIQGDMLRSAYADLVRASWQGDPSRAQNDFEGLTRLNNEFSNLQREMARKNAELSSLYEEVRRLSITDPLTGILNRRGFFVSAERDFDRARRYQQSYSIALADIDIFKKINDEHGHQVGDAALASVAACFRGIVRTTDLLGRYGGEEFIFLFLETTLEGAVLVAERLRTAAAGLEIPVGAGLLRLTVSFGVAPYTPDCASLDVLIRRADEAMYSAKAAGRNQVKIWGE